MDFDGVVRRVQAEFNEMPGLRLTLAQATRLWGLEQRTCEAVVDVLIRNAFLRRTSCGSIMRMTA